MQSTISKLMYKVNSAYLNMNLAYNQLLTDCLKVLNQLFNFGIFFETYTKLVPLYNKLFTFYCRLQILFFKTIFTENQIIDLFPENSRHITWTRLNNIIFLSNEAFLQCSQKKFLYYQQTSQ